MPTVLQINIGTRKSTGTIAESINRIAAKNGWEIYFAYGRSVGPCESKLIHIGNKLTQAIALMESRLFDRDGLSSRLATRLLVKEIKKIKPDIIHLHNLHGYYINYKILFQYLNYTEIPVVWTLHDCWAFTGHCSHFAFAQCERWKTGCYQCPQKKVYPKSLWIDRSKQNYELKKKLFTAKSRMHIVVVSQWLANLAKQSFLKDQSIHIINNGIDLNVFKPIPHEEHSKYNVLGVASVWGKGKGLFDFYKLYEMLDPEQYTITLIGLSEAQIRELPSGINGLQRTNSVQELALQYSNANVFVNPTYADSFPTTNLEALACGTPVVMYRTDGSPEAIDERTGVVVDQGDIDGLASAVVEICKQGKSQFEDACRNRAKSFFNREERFMDYLKLYNVIRENR